MYIKNGRFVLDLKSIAGIVYLCFFVVCSTSADLYIHQRIEQIVLNKMVWFLKSFERVFDEEIKYNVQQTIYSHTSDLYCISCVFNEVYMMF